MPTTAIGADFSDELTRLQREALATAGIILVDEWYHAIGEMLVGRATPMDTALADALPPSYRLRLTPVLAKQFHICLIVVLDKLTQPSWPRLACLAEELALRALIDRAEAHLEEMGAPEEDRDFRVFADHAFDDSDHLHLYNPRWDGVDDSAIGHLLGIGSLALKDCFTVYAEGAYGAVHPYCADEPADGVAR